MSYQKYHGPYLSLSSQDIQVWLVVPYINGEQRNHMVMKEDQLQQLYSCKKLIFYSRYKGERTQPQMEQWGKQGWAWWSLTIPWNWGLCCFYKKRKGSTVTFNWQSILQWKCTQNFKILRCRWKHTNVLSEVSNIWNGFFYKNISL